jgi:hypothetical protein
MLSAVKDPKKVAAGKAGSREDKARAGALGARKRWGPRRVVRLDDLTPEQRAVVMALVDAAKAAKASDPPEQAA